ncbi:zona pellucida sperm-binding protein 1-like [Symsagittifera roscoffensis]|uniref:zona pellucida sperm-binding protein 1-like n=1 Tax=Symsagittifera roscoffensis TaxID=84072 RepID=UPI00307B3EA1
MTNWNQRVITAFCSFDARGYVTAFFRAVQEVPLNATGFNYYQYSLRLYKSGVFSHYFREQDYPVVVTIGDDLYFGAALKTQQLGLKVLARTCWASKTNSPLDPERYYLQRDGCPEDPTFIRLPSDDPHLDRFSFQAFQFMVDQTAVVYIHCEVFSCAGDDKTNTNQVCSVPSICPRRYKRQIATINTLNNYELQNHNILINKTTILAKTTPKTTDVKEPSKTTRNSLIKTDSASSAIRSRRQQQQQQKSPSGSRVEKSAYLQSGLSAGQYERVIVSQRGAMVFVPKDSNIRPNDILVIDQANGNSDPFQGRYGPNDVTDWDRGVKPIHSVLVVVAVCLCASMFALVLALAVVLITPRCFVPLTIGMSDTID